MTAALAKAERPAPRNRARARFMRHRGAVVSALVLTIIVAAAIGAPLVEGWLGHGPNDPDLGKRFLSPTWAFPLGTDEAGRDVLLRLMYGGRVSLLVGLAAALASAVIGTAIGIVAGYYGGRLDAFLMRLTDAVISLPSLALLIVLAAVDLKKIGVPDSIAYSDAVSLYRIIFIISLVGWTGVARLVRGATLSMRTREFVRAAVALGAPARRIMLVHILPNVLGPVIVATTLSVGGIILAESVLSYLGLGIQPPIASWGNMLSNAQEMLTQAPQLVIYPGLAIMLTVIAFNFLGDGLQDALDPRAGE
ncbi:MAG TPA: ABC transporter permease [Alphaproteobacteria bacterium]|jgi:peptide/nickel transport system permease protein